MSLSPFSISVLSIALHRARGAAAFLRTAALGFLVHGGLGPAAAAADITVAIAGPNAGVNAGRTHAIWDGVRATANAINATGGVRGAAIKLIRKDDGCTSDRAARAAEELAALRVDLVIGHPCSGAAQSAAKVYAAKGVIFIAPSSRHPALTAERAGATIFRIAGRDDKQADAAAAFFLEHFKGKALAIVQDRTRYARELAERVSALLAKAGEKEPTVATLVAGELEFPRVTEKIKSADAIFFAGFPVEAGMLHAQLRASGARAAMLFSDSVGSTEFTGTFGADLRETFILRARFAINGDDPALQSSDGARLRDGDRANGAAALEAYAEAAQRADALAPASVQIILNGYLLKAPSGVMQFDANGDADRPSFDILQWTGHSWNGGPNSAPLDMSSRERLAQ